MNTSCELLAAVILLNVLSYFSPIRELIRNGIKEGFIRPQNEQLVIFVDGPADLPEHETFDWGQAALDAINSWQYDKFQTLPFHWPTDVDDDAKPTTPATTSTSTPTPTVVDNGNGNGNGHSINNKGSLRQTGRWLRKAWHLRTRSYPLSVLFSD